MGNLVKILRSPLVLVPVCVVGTLLFFPVGLHYSKESGIVVSTPIGFYFSERPINPNPFTAARADGGISVKSRGELLDKFMQADRFLEQYGFHTAEPPPLVLGMKGGVIS